jgi:DNA polymerase (family 10)
MPAAPRTNTAIARRLGEAADLLEFQQASPFRVSAYRRAAATIEALHEDLEKLGATPDAHLLEALPGIGPGIAAAIREMLATGHWSQLERLRGSTDPPKLFTIVPGIGPVLARRIHDSLGIESLEALEIAAHDGSLAGVAGVGPRRLQSLQASLAAALGRPSSARLRRPAAPRPSVGEILAIDAEYRKQAALGNLRRIAPKRFNPSGEAWLPIMHAQRGEWHFTSLFSNTARAHQLRRTHDWVVIYYYDHDHLETQSTVVTETSGPLTGLRIVRGRELECVDHYGVGGAAHARPAAQPSRIPEREMRGDEQRNTASAPRTST